MWWRKSPYKIAKTKVFGHNFNKTRQTLSDVILQEGDGVAVIPTLAKKITSELAEVMSGVVLFPDLLAKAGLAKPLTAFSKTFVRRSGI